MKRGVLFWASLACSWLAPVGTQEPGPLATPTQKLDHLLSKCRGQPVSRVREVWGREDDTEMRGTNPVLIYEKRIKGSATVGGLSVRPNGGMRCVVRFLIGDAEEVLRVARQGGGAECCKAWHENQP